MPDCVLDIASILIYCRDETKFSVTEEMTQFSVTEEMTQFSVTEEIIIIIMAADGGYERDVVHRMNEG